MGFNAEERLTDSPYLETITRGYTDCSGSIIRPAENHWHMVLLKLNGETRLLVVGPLTTSGLIHYGEGAELLWIKFKLGTFMPHLPAKNFLDTETALPDASSNSFWLKGSAWQFPDFENVETFVNRLARQEILVRDPLVDAVLKEEPQDLSPRTLRHRFLQATGLSQNQIQQLQRARQAVTLLEQGRSIFDTIEEAGYFDQPHLTRALKRWIGHTPAEIIRLNNPL